MRQTFSLQNYFSLVVLLGFKQILQLGLIFATSGRPCRLDCDGREIACLRWALGLPILGSFRSRHMASCDKFSAQKITFTYLNIS